MTDKLKNNAIRHNPNALINYVEMLIQTARVQGATSQQLIQTTAKNALIVAAGVEKRGGTASGESEVVIAVLEAVQSEMKRRVEIDAETRVSDESKPCKMYNDLYNKLPEELKPRILKEAGTVFVLFSTNGASYSTNLKAVARSASPY